MEISWRRSKICLFYFLMNNYSLINFVDIIYKIRWTCIVFPPKDSPNHEVDYFNRADATFLTWI